MQEYSEMITVLPSKDENDNPSISIKEKYRFDTYKDACHMQKDEIDE